MRLDVGNDGGGGKQVEVRLARLIASVLNVARAANRFDELVVMASTAACDHCRAFLNGPTRACISLELGGVVSGGIAAAEHRLRMARPRMAAQMKSA